MKDDINDDDKYGKMDESEALEYHYLWYLHRQISRDKFRREYYNRER